MSWCLRKMAHRKNYELEREKSTRISARHNNICDNYLQCKTLKRKRIKRLKENLKPYRVITCKTRRLVHSDTHPSKPEESSVTDDNASDQKNISSDVIKTLTYSSSDSNSSNNNKVENSKALSCKTFDQKQVLDKKNINGREYYGKELATENSNSAILKSVTNLDCYNLRRRVSPRVDESDSKTLKKDKRCSGLRTPQLEEDGDKTPNKATLSSVTCYNLRKGPQFQLSNDKTLDNVALSTVSNKRTYRRSPRFAKNENNSSNNAALSGVTSKKSYNLRRSPRFEDVRETSNNADLSSATNKGSCNYSRSPQVEENSNNKTTKNAVFRSVANKRSNNLRSPRFAESSSETSNIGDERITEKKTQKTKVKAKRSKNIRKPSTGDIVSKKSACTPSFSSNQEKGVEKAKVKKKGPVARKRELRAMLEKQDEGYEDDAFEGTPFRNRKSLLKCKLSPVILDTSLQSISTETEFKTPYIIKTPVNRLRPAGPLSSATSESDIMTPGLLNSVNRNDIDCYVNKLKKRKIYLAPNRKIKSHTPLSKKHDRIIQSKLFDFNCNGNYSLPNSTTESEDCEDADYYWSDME